MVVVMMPPMMMVVMMPPVVMVVVMPPVMMVVVMVMVPPLGHLHAFAGGGRLPIPVDGL